MLLFLFAEWQPHTHGGGCEEAVVRSGQRSKQRSLATASNIVFAGFFQIGQGLCVQNSYWVLQAELLLGTSGSIFERRMISPPQDGVLEPWNIRCCLKYPKGENQDSEMLIFWPDFPGDTKYTPSMALILKKEEKEKIKFFAHRIISSHHLINAF